MRLEVKHSEEPTMQSLELLLDLIAFIFVLYATYGRRDQDDLALVGNVSNLELNTPISFGFTNQTPQDNTTETDDLPPWDVDEVIEVPNVQVPEPEVNPVEGRVDAESPEVKGPEEELIPFDVNVPDIPSRNEVFSDQETTKELSIDVNQITAKKAWKAAKALGLPYKNPDRSRIKVTVLRENIETYLRENPSQISDVLPFVG